MAWIFSKRCSTAIKTEKIKVSLPSVVRIRLLKMLQNYNEEFRESTDTGFIYETSILQKMPEEMKAELGIKQLLAFPESGEGVAKPSSFEDFILRGNYPPLIFDAIEIFYIFVNEERKLYFQNTFNSIMEETNLCWRMLDGKIFPIDSAYIEEEVIRKAHYLLSEVKFQGALEEFEKARIDLTNGEYKDAIDNANMAVESTIKSILRIEKAKPGELFRKMIDSGLIPEYFSGFLKAFEEHILRCNAIIRNEELGVGHGQGVKVNKIPEPLAELAVNLSGVLINFLIKNYLRNKRV